MRTPPPIPKNTCPDIDDVIRTMESLRESNSILRENAEYYMDRCKELEEELKKAIEKIEEMQMEIT